MYKDIITYELAEGVTEEHLINVAKKIIDGWMKSLKGFQKWEIHSLDDNSYTDIVYWDSKEAAKLAEADMMKMPNAAEWFMCYKEGTIEGKGLSLIANF